MIENILLVGLAFALGGVLKGAIGAGAPLLAVPVLALLYDVPTAITLFAIPNLVPNVWQVWKFRADHLPPVFLWRFSIAGAIGAAVGTVILASVDPSFLLLIVALIVLVYILFRLMRPDWQLAHPLAMALVFPVGLVAGMMQASGGISAPVSITFLNAMKLTRGGFINTISLFFTAIAVVQIPLLIAYGYMTPGLFGLSCAALVVVVAFMPVGGFLVSRVSRSTFDRIVLLLLAALSAKMIAQAIVAGFAG